MVFATAFVGCGCPHHQLKVTPRATTVLQELPQDAPTSFVPEGQPQVVDVASDEDSFTTTDFDADLDNDPAPVPAPDKQALDAKKAELRERFRSNQAIKKVLRLVGTLEVFCGCAELSRQLSTIGFEAKGIDWRFTKDVARHPCVYLDLTQLEGQKQFWVLVAGGNVRLVWFAPPCGTASAARNIRRSTVQGSPARLDPKPLRSLECPDGLPGLKTMDALRVEAANKLYKFVCGAVQELSRQRICWAIENPASSLMWTTTPFVALLAAKTSGSCEVASVSFAHCMHGGGRDKRTSVWHGGGWSLASLAAECDNSHSHRPWGLSKEPGTLFATAEERNYPRLLCERIAKIVAKYFDLPLTASRDAASVSQAAKIAAGTQPRRAFRELIPEFQFVTQIYPTCLQKVEHAKTLAASRGKDAFMFQGKLYSKGHKVPLVFKL